MVQTCSRCSRVNPEEASFCYFDGIGLGGRSHASAGVQMDFPKPIRYPSGKTCSNFNELASTILSDWTVSLDMMKKGEFGTFFSGIGRLDLAMVATESAKHPEPVQGLDQFLARLPSQPIPPADLEVDPPTLDLGTLKPGKDIKCSVKIRNKGRRILYGSVSIEGIPWLSIGEGKPRSRSRFNTFQDAPLPMTVFTNSLRTSEKTVEGKLIFETSGGNLIVPVTAEIPIRPFMIGTLAGAKSPKQLAEKAKANPTGAAVLFENGTVESWYKENGWVYPVPKPPAQGLAAIQQFFEALGYVKPPKVLTTTNDLLFELQPGDVKEQTITLFNEEKKSTYAYAKSDKPWVRIAKPVLKGGKAYLKISVSTSELPTSLELATLSITTNGNQSIKVNIEAQVLVQGSEFADLTGDVAPVMPQFLGSPFASNEPSQGSSQNTGFPEPTSAPILSVHPLARKVKSNQWLGYAIAGFFGVSLISLIGTIIYLGIRKMNTQTPTPAPATKTK
jgi:hypothetical protein